MPNFILPILLLVYIIINIKYSKYQMLNISNFLEIIPIILVSLFLERYQFIVNLFIYINILILLIIPILQLLNRNNSILKEIKSRYFYIFTIIIYLYIFLLLMGKNQSTVYESQIMFPSLIVISFSLVAYFLIKTIPINKNAIDLKHSILLITINSLLLTLITTINLIYYPVPIMMNCLTIALLFLLPVILKCYKESRINGYNNSVRYIITILTLTFIIMGIIDLMIPTSIYIFINNNSIKLLKIGLYTSCVLAIPMMSKFKYHFLYDILVFIIVTIIIYYLY